MSDVGMEGQGGGRLTQGRGREGGYPYTTGRACAEQV